MPPVHPAVLDQVIVQILPEVRVVEHVARVRVPQMSFPSLDMPKTGLQDRTGMFLLKPGEEFEEVDEEAEEEVKEDEEMFDESIDRFEHAGFRPRRPCVHWKSRRAFHQCGFICIAEQIVVCQCHRSCQKWGCDSACAFRRRADRGPTCATDHGHIVLFVQLAMQTVAFNCSLDKWK